MKRPGARAILVLAALLAAAAPGCYQKVVGAKGFGADRTRIEEPNVPDEKGSRTLGYPKYTHRKLPGD